jgi:hypothetical protein
LLLPLEGGFVGDTPQAVNAESAGSFSFAHGSFWPAPPAFGSAARLSRIASSVSRGRPARTLVRRGRLPPPFTAVQGAMHEAALTRDVALRSRRVRIEHEDPADRFLAATAEVYELTLVTADERLLRGKGFRTLAKSLRASPCFSRSESRHVDEPGCCASEPHKRTAPPYTTICSGLSRIARSVSRYCAPSTPLSWR